MKRQVACCRSDKSAYKQHFPGKVVELLMAKDILCGFDQEKIAPNALVSPGGSCQNVTVKFIA